MKSVTVFTTFNQAEAQIVRSHLEAAGFHPFVANENGNLVFGGFSAAATIRIELPETEVDDARELLATISK